MSLSDQHLDDELVALRALGEPLTSTASDHLLSCARCASEVDQFAAVVSTARSLTPDDAPSAPGAEVWARISDGLQLDQPDTPASLETGLAPRPAGADTDGDDGVVISLADRRRRWPTAVLVAASIAGVVAGGVVALGGSALVGGEQPSAPIASPVDVVGSTSLVALPDHEGTGKAEIVKTPDGPELVVDVEALSAGEGFYEVWLIDPKTFEMVGLGALNNDAGRFPIPDGLDLSKYTVVDVSLEPYDGDPVHSKDSVVRGEIST